MTREKTKVKGVTIVNGNGLPNNVDRRDNYIINKCGSNRELTKVILV
jgi:inosine-uridine nucleoside N-ribohydrolase